MVVGSAVVWLLAHAREPRYQDKSVSYWFQEYCLQSTGRTADADHDWNDIARAFRSLGTNALPFLAAHALDDREYSRLETNVQYLLQQLPAFLRPEPAISRDGIREFAAGAIAELNLPGRVILPAVQAALAGTNVVRQTAAVWVLSGLHDHDPAVTACLVQALHYQDPMARSLAVSALGNLRANAASAVPPLRDAFARITDPNERRNIAVALCKIDAQQPEALSYLTADLRAGTQDAIKAATRLAEIGTNARPAIPALLQAFQATNSTVIPHAVQALRRIGASPDEFIPLLRLGLDSPRDYVRFDSADEILDFLPSDPAALSTLVELARHEPNYRHPALFRLSRLGSDARAIAPTLRELENTSDTDLRSAVQGALDKIDPPASAR